MDVDVGYADYVECLSPFTHTAGGGRIRLHGKERRAVTTLLLEIIRGYFNRSHVINSDESLKCAVSKAIRSHLPNRGRRVDHYLELSRILNNEDNSRFTAIGYIRLNFNVNVSSVLRRYKSLG